MNISAVAASALQAASTAVSLRADNIVNADTPKFTAKEPVYGGTANGGVAVFAQETGAPVSLLSETLGMISGTQQYKAAALLIRTDDEMSDQLLKTFA